jgi:alcohol dehydrogenase class IV
MRGVLVPHVPQLQHATPAFRTFCGQDALAALPRELDRVGASRAVIVCAPWVRDHPDALAAVGNALGARLAGCFDGVQDHSPVPAVEAARRTLEDARADAVVAVGGGSAIVTARAATILLAEKRPVRDLCTQREPDGRLVSPRLAAPKIPNWIVPTTPITAYAKAGSAVRDPDTGERLALFDPKTRAQGIFLDPALALTAPAGLASAAALNAFAMAVESLQASRDDPLAEALLLQALRMLTQWLPRLHAAAGDAEPRLRLMLAALLCGQGSDYVGGGLAQALSHAAGPRSSVSNGVIEALLLPHAMRFNAPVTGAGLTLIAETLDACPDAAAAPDERAIAAVGRFLAGLTVPARLRDVGVTRPALAEVAVHAMNDWAITRVPRRVKRPELDELLHGAW